METYLVLEVETVVRGFNVKAMCKADAELKLEQSGFSDEHPDIVCAKQWNKVTVRDAQCEGLIERSLK